MANKMKRAKEIQNAIRTVLFREWDPIGINDVPELSDEYNPYVGKVYRALVSGHSQQELITLLHTLESEDIEIFCGDTSELTEVANKLLEIDVTLGS